MIAFGFLRSVMHGAFDFRFSWILDIDLALITPECRYGAKVSYSEAKRKKVAIVCRIK